MTVDQEQVPWLGLQHCRHPTSKFCVSSWPHLVPQAFLWLPSQGRTDQQCPLQVPLYCHVSTVMNTQTGIRKKKGLRLTR